MCVHTHTATQHSPFHLLYGVLPQIPSDTNLSSSVDIPEEDWEVCLQNINHTRSYINKLLLNHAITTKQIQDNIVQKTSFKPGQWVLVQNKGPQKFQGH